MLFDHKEAMERINRIYRELGVPPDDEDVLVRWERMRPQPEPEPRAHKPDTAPLTLAEIDQRIAQSIAVEHELMVGILAELVAYLQDEAPTGPAGTGGARGWRLAATAGQYGGGLEHGSLLRPMAIRVEVTRP